MGGLQNELYCNSLDQTAAAFELSPVCINSDSELEIHFNDVSSVAAAELSPKLPSSNNSSESIVYGSVHQQVPMPVPSLDDSLNSGVRDRRFSASPDVTSSIGPEQEDCNSIANENQSIQPSEDHCTTRSDVFIAKEDDNAQESKDDQASEDCNVLEASDENQDCHECFTKQEIVFKKDKATLHVISKRCEETVIIPMKLEGNPLTLIYSKVCRLITIGLAVNEMYLINFLPLGPFDCRVYITIM